MPLVTARKPPALDDLHIAARDHVRVPDGRIGEVVGFYRDERETVLVRLSVGDSQRYVPEDLSPALPA